MSNLPNRPPKSILLLTAALAAAIYGTLAVLAAAREPKSPNVSGTFIDSGQSLGNSTSQAVALGNLDGQPGLDAFIANNGANAVYLNNGAAQFSGNGQALGSLNSEGVAVSNLDGDSDLDAVIANSNGLNRAWINNGLGQFSGGQSFEGAASRGVALGDLDGVGGPDAFFANSGGNTVWFNTNGVFSDSGQSLGTSQSYAVALGDLDGDGDLDAFVANGSSSSHPDKVWINQGGDQGGDEGTFADSGQNLGSIWSYAVALGDLDGDDDLDAFTASWFPTGNKIWLNNGSGVFSDSGQTLGSASSIGVELGDVDGDDELDAFVANNSPAGSHVWINDGDGNFTDSGQALGADTTAYDVGLADLNGDGVRDAFVANFGPNRIYLNGSDVFPSAAFDVDRATNDDGKEVFYQEVSSPTALLPILLSHIYTNPIEVHIQVEAPGETYSEVMDFEPGDQLKYLSLTASNPDPEETYNLILSVTPQGVTPTPADETDELLFTFVDQNEGMEFCILCFTEWLGQLVGIDPIFDSLHHLPLEEQMASPLWTYYTALFDANSVEMSTIMATNPPLLWDALGTIDEWTPALQSLSDGEGDTFVLSQQMVDDTIGLIDGIKGEAGPGLKAAIQQEENALDLASFAGLNMDQAWSTMEARRSISEMYLAITLK